MKKKEIKKTSKLIPVMVSYGIVLVTTIMAGFGYFWLLRMMDPGSIQGDLLRTLLMTTLVSALLTLDYNTLAKYKTGG